MKYESKTNVTQETNPNPGNNRKDLITQVAL